MGGVFKKKPMEPGVLGPVLQADLARRGQAADQALGEPGKAIEGYELILRRLAAVRVPDTPLMAKTTLGLLMARILDDDIAEARLLWAKQVPGPKGELLKQGIEQLQAGSVSPRDHAIFLMAEAFMHTCNRDRQAVDATMTRVKDLPEAMVRSHWNYCLKRLGLEYPEGEAKFSIPAPDPWT